MLDGVRAGNVIAFGVEGYKGKETVVVVAEVRTEQPDVVRSAIHRRTLEVCGLPPRDVMLVQPGSCRRRRRASCSGPSAASSTSTRNCSSREVRLHAGAPAARSADRDRAIRLAHAVGARRRAEAIRETLVADGSFTLVGPDEWGLAPVRAVHDSGLSTSSPARGRSTSSSTRACATSCLTCSTDRRSDAG